MIIAPENAEGLMKTVYDSFNDQLGAIPGPIKLFSASPDAWQVYMQYVDFIRNHKTLSAKMKTCLRYIIAKRNGFVSCTDFNAMLLKSQGVDDRIREAMVDNLELAPLSEKEKCLLSFTVATIEDPRNSDSQKLTELRNQGWSDSEVFDLTWHGTMMISVGIMAKAFNESF